VKLYGHPWSLNTRKVLMALAEKGHEAELVFVDIPRGEHKQPAHLARHPFGKAPALEHDGFVVYETSAVLHYLDEVLPGPSLWPEAPRARARARQWERVAHSYFEPHAHPLLVHAIFMRHLGGQVDPAVIEAGRQGMGQALDVLDQALVDSPHLAGERFTLADLEWMPYLEYLEQIGEDTLGGRPHARAWWQRISARPAWQQVARTGPQPYEPSSTPELIRSLHRGR
jgi:glutathione S-transferase